MNDHPHGPRLNLSVGELAFALGNQGFEQAALDLVGASFVLARDEDARLVLAASGHSLLVRSLVRIDPDNHYHLAPALERATRLLAFAEQTYMCSRFTGGEAAVLSFHAGPGGVIKHSTENELVHVIEELPDIGGAAAAAADFYEAPEGAPALATLTLPLGLAEEIRDGRGREFIEGRLSRAGAARDTRSALADDLLNPKFRGSVSRVDHRADGTSLAEHRLHLLRGNARLWLLVPKESGAETFIEFSPASRTTLKAAFSRVAREPVL